jgi:hypothetical protein
MNDQKGLALFPNHTFAWLDFSLDNAEPLVAPIRPGMLELIQVCLPGGEWLNGYLDEEGKLNGLDPNYAATRLWEQTYGPTDFLVGPVVLFSSETQEGEERGLSQTEIASLSTYLRHINCREVVAPSAQERTDRV